MINLHTYGKRQFLAITTDLTVTDRDITVPVKILVDVTDLSKKEHYTIHRQVSATFNKKFLVQMKPTKPTTIKPWWKRIWQK